MVQMYLNELEKTERSSLVKWSSRNDKEETDLCLQLQQKVGARNITSIWRLFNVMQPRR